AITAPGCVLSSCATARELFMTAAGRESLDNGILPGRKKLSESSPVATIVQCRRWRWAKLQFPCVVHSGFAASTLQLCQRPLKGNVRRLHNRGGWSINIEDKKNGRGEENPRKERSCHDGIARSAIPKTGEDDGQQEDPHGV